MEEGHDKGVAVLPDRLVIFDGVCNLCEASVTFIIARDPQAKFSFVAAQSPKGQAVQQQFGIDALQDASVVLIRHGQVFTHSDAGLEIARDLEGGWRLLYYSKIIPRVLRDGIYAFIANNRYRWFGRKEVCMLPTPEDRARFL